MKSTTLASVTVFLSMSFLAHALTGYDCEGENVSHEVIMGQVNKSYDDRARQNPEDTFFTNSRSFRGVEFPFRVSGAPASQSTVLIYFNNGREVLNVYLITSGNRIMCSPVKEWS
ncbi:BgTH12-01344 [Blumeria graminis f. sp. triticale]|uniref:BgtE-20079 n=3 Tax=Blumeria graminis TaxID=34373 RepID=A0A381L5H0_BLUGR|nr:BgTH12-01344 [Blumeria graminis f. sp. triticale]VDB94027.1 BgtE-20079 [Blumeria graminis f. sp. tritici]